jgi:hypothetical protein
MAVNIEGSSSDLVLFLGGLECSDAASCSLAPSSYGSAELQAYVTRANPLIQRDEPLNPLRGWNHVFIPSCTGDLNAGNHPDAIVPGVDGTQQFVGRPNMLAFVDRLAEELPDVERIVLAGCSSGAFGARMSFELLNAAFPSATVTTVMDSGPALPDPYYPSAVQQRQRELWNLDATVLAECGATCDDPNDFAEDVFDRLLGLYPDNVFAVIGYTDDGALTGFWSTDPSMHAGGLLAHRDRMVQAHANVAFYIIPESDHCVGQLFTSTVVDGITLPDWIASVVDGQISQVGP